MYRSSSRGRFLAVLVLAGITGPVFAREPAEDVRVLDGHRGSVLAVAFAPDGRTLASSGGGGDTSVRLWDKTGILK